MALAYRHKPWSCLAFENQQLVGYYHFSSAAFTTATLSWWVRFFNRTQPFHLFHFLKWTRTGIWIADDQQDPVLGSICRIRDATEYILVFFQKLHQLLTLLWCKLIPYSYILKPFTCPNFAFGNYEVIAVLKPCSRTAAAMYRFLPIDLPRRIGLINCRCGWLPCRTGRFVVSPEHVDVGIPSSVLRRECDNRLDPHLPLHGIAPSNA